MVEPQFHPDSYGYRPRESAIDALSATRRRCWRFDWVPVVQQVPTPSIGIRSLSTVRGPSHPIRYARTPLGTGSLDPVSVFAVAFSALGG